MLRKIFGPKGDEVTRDWRRQRNEELHDPYQSPNIFRLIKYVRMRCVRYVAVWGRGGMHIGFWWGNLREREHSEDLGVDGRIILERTLKEIKMGGRELDTFA